MIKNKATSDLRTLINIAELKAEQFADGHLTIFRFKTEWKAMLGTPTLDTHESREQVRDLRGHESLEEALEYLIIRPIRDTGGYNDP